MSQIIEALRKLDPNNDEHWTADGLPKLEALGVKDVKRAEVTKAAPHFTRTTPTIVTPADIENARLKEAEAKKVVEKTEIERALDVLKARQDVVAGLERKRYEVTTELQKALAAQDEAQREVHRLEGARTSQHDILDYLASVRADHDRKIAEALAKRKG